MEHCSPAYRFTTTDLNDPRIAALRAETKVANKAAHRVGKDGGRVHVKGRAGRNNPYVTKWQLRDGGVPLGIATRFDVYVHSDHYGWRKAERLHNEERRMAREAEAARQALITDFDRDQMVRTILPILSLVVSNGLSRGISLQGINVTLQAAVNATR